jgi:hypothetical protein
MCAFVPSNLVEAVIECVPAASVEMVSVAVPLLSLPLPIDVLPS